MDAEQDTRYNPYDMDEACRNCPGLCEVRDRVVHGYGDVGADFLVIGESPSRAAEEAGVPFVGDEAGETVQHVLGSVGLNHSLPSSTEPEVENVYLTYLARCRHPERDPTETEVDTCEPFLNAEVRMINPEILIPVGQRALDALALDYTTERPEDLDVEARHATTVRGRGFEILPMLDPGDQTEAETEAYVDALAELMGRDYRQTKGRRSR
ncbi:MAG: uracil-DNA glycosylase family protein [Halobacteriaceae archaeon]